MTEALSLGHCWTVHVWLDCVGNLYTPADDPVDYFNVVIHEILLLFLHCTFQRSPGNQTASPVLWCVCFLWLFVDEVWVSVGKGLFFVCSAMLAITALAKYQFFYLFQTNHCCCCQKRETHHFLWTRGLFLGKTNLTLSVWNSKCKSFHQLVVV